MILYNYAIDNDTKILFFIFIFQFDSLIEDSDFVLGGKVVKNPDKVRFEGVGGRGIFGRSFGSIGSAEEVVD